MDAILSPVPMAVIVVLYVYAQLRSLMGWDGGWRTASLIVLFGELIWLAYSIGSQGDFVMASIVLGCMVGLVIFVAAFLLRLLFQSLH